MQLKEWHPFKGRPLTVESYYEYLRISICNLLGIFILGYGAVLEDVDPYSILKSIQDSIDRMPV